MKRITLDSSTNAYIEYELANNHYVVLSTYVDDSLRGQGVGKKLYKEFVKLVKKTSGTFSSDCSYIKKIAQFDNEVKEIFVSK